MTEVVLAVVLGLLFALGTFLVLRRDVVRVVWGISIISQAANVYLVTMGGIGGAVPVIPRGDHAGGPAPTDPLVQALVLTAIVIGFGTTAFALALTYRLYQEHGSIDTADLGEDHDRVSDELASVGGDGAVSTDGSGDDAVATDGGADTDPDPVGDTGKGGDT